MSDWVDSGSSRDHCVGRLTIIVNDIYKLLCALGFFVQLTYVMIRYSSFDYLTTAKFGVPDTTILPDFFFCSDFISFLNFTLLFTRYPQLMKELGLSRNFLSTSRRSIKEQILTRLSVKNVSLTITRYLSLRQVTECLYTSDELFGTLDIKHNLDKKIADLCEFRLFYRGFMVCFVFACSINGSIVASTNDYYKNPVANELFLLQIRHSFFRSVDYIFIGTTNPKTLPVSPSCKMDVQTMTDYPRAFRYHLKTVELTLLPPPYSTNCRDYSHLGSNYTSRDGVLDSCLTEKTVQATGCPHPMSLQASHWDLPFASECYERNSKNTSYRRLINSIVDDCFRLYPQPDCTRIAYFIQGRAPVTLQGEFGTLVLDETKEPNIWITYEPKMTWLDCLVQAGSCLGTWFGFSILIHIPKISRFLVIKVHSCLTCSDCCQQNKKVSIKRKPVMYSTSSSLTSSTNQGKTSYRPSIDYPFRYISPTLSMIRERNEIPNTYNRLLRPIRRPIHRAIK